MLSIFKPGLMKIVRLFYEDKTTQLHVREIARRTGLHGPSVHRHLGSLEKDGILASEKDGNLKKYAVRNCAETYFLFEAFDLERFGRLPSIRRKAIRTYLGSLPEQPVFAVLFGSTAKGTYKDDSDIDILLVTNRAIDAKGAEKEADALAGIKVSTFQMVYGEFLAELKMRDDEVVQSAIASGYPLKDRIRYYEVLHHERVRAQQAAGRPSSGEGEDA